MNTDNHSTKQNLECQSERSPMDSQSKSTTQCSKKKLDRSSSAMTDKKLSTHSGDSLTNVNKANETPLQEKTSSGEFRVAGIEFRYSIKDGKRFINDMPAEEFMATLSHAQMLAIVHAAVIKNQIK